MTSLCSSVYLINIIKFSFDGKLGADSLFYVTLGVYTRQNLKDRQCNVFIFLLPF